MNRRTYKWLVGLTLLLGVHTTLHAQQPDTLRLDSLTTVSLANRNLAYMTDDALGNLYLLDQNNALEKYTIEGRLLYRYTNKRLGRIHSLDATNPLKLLVWYGDFRTIAFLDRSLTPLGGELNLINAGFPEVRTVAAAADGNIWIMDEATFRLRKIAPDGTQLFESQDLNLIFPKRLSVSYMYDDGSRIFVADTATGVLVFDTYAQYQKLLAPKGISTFFFQQRYLCWLGEDPRLHGVDVQFAANERVWNWPLGLSVSKEKILLLPYSIVSENKEKRTRWRWRLP